MSKPMKPSFPVRLGAAFLSATFVGSAAFAKTKPSEVGPIRVSLPESSLSRSVMEPEKSVAKSIFPAMSPEVSVFFWSTSDFRTPSHLESEAFSVGVLPMVSAGLVSDPTIVPRLGGLRWYGGLGLGRFTRSGYLPQAVGRRQVSQDLWVIPARLGARLETSFRLGSKVQPLFFAGVMPSLALSKTTAFGDGLFELGFPVEVGAGVSLPLSAYAKSIGFSGLLTAGSLAGGNMFGFGLRASVEL